MTENFCLKVLKLAVLTVLWRQHNFSSDTLMFVLHAYEQHLFGMLIFQEKFSVHIFVTLRQPSLFPGRRIDNSQVAMTSQAHN